MILADEQTHLRLTLARAATMADRGSITSGEMMLEMGLQRMARLAAPFTRRAGTGAPDKRERRELRKLKGRS